MKRILFCITEMRYEEKRIYQFLKDGQYKVDILLDSMDLDQVVLRRNNYGVAIIRILSQHKALETAQYLETLGIVCLNSSKAIKICSDKAMQALLLIGNQSVQQPAFSIIRKYADIKKEYQRFKDAIVVKPINSSWGRGISLLNSSNTLSVWLEAHEDLDIQGERLPFLVQEYIDKPNYDLRIIIIDNKPVVGFKRISESNWKTNTHLGAVVEPIVLTNKIKDICSEMVGLLGCGIYGLDLMKDSKGNFLFCEINQNPEFAHSWKVHKVDVAKKIADYAIASMEKRS